MTESLTEKLLAIAAECANLTPVDVLDSIHRPSWSECRRGDWELYIASDIRDLWPDMSIESRLTAFILAIVWAEEAAIRRDL